MKVLNPATVMPPQGGYSQGIQAGELVFVAGQVGLDADGKPTGDGGMAAQTRQTIANIIAVLAEAGATLADVVSATVYVKDFSEYKINRTAMKCYSCSTTEFIMNSCRWKNTEKIFRLRFLLKKLS